MSNMLDTRFFKFGIVGLSGMCIDFSVTWICKEKLKLNKYLSNSFGFSCAVINNFLLNRYWTFESSSQLFAGQFTKFISVSVAGLLINNILLYFLLKYIKTNFYFLKFVVIAIVFLWSFFINSLYTFN